MSNKAELSLILTKSLFEVAKVGSMGSELYGRYDWQEKPLDWSKHLDAAFRHLMEFSSGNRKDIDKDCPDCSEKICKKHSGLSHLAHAAWRILALLESETQGIGKDDLFKGYEKKEVYGTHTVVSEGTIIQPAMGTIKYYDNKGLD